MRERWIFDPVSLLVTRLTSVAHSCTVPQGIRKYITVCSSGRVLTVVPTEVGTVPGSLQLQY